MTVEVATLDILTERAHFDPAVARAIGEAIDMQINCSLATLATRAELNDFRKEFDYFRAEVRKEFDEVRGEFHAFRAEVNREFVAVRSEVRQEFAAVRNEIRQECNLVRAEVHVAVAQSKAEIMRFIFTAVATQAALITGVMTGVMYFMLRYGR